MNKASQFTVQLQKSLKSFSYSHHISSQNTTKIDDMSHLLHHSLTCHLQSCCRNPEASSTCLWELIVYDAPAQNKGRD